jgi:hypothetical protein
MKRGMIFPVCLLFTSAGIAAAQGDSDAAWIGVWLAELDGQPSVTLTLAKDTGALDGTIVLNIITRQDGQPHVIASEPHVLIHPRLESSTLSFGLKKIDGSGDLMNFTVALDAEGKAKIHCLNCGVDAPVVELAKAQ